MFFNKKLYFIRCGDYVKIGTSKSVKDRVNQLQTGNPEEIFIMAEFDKQAIKEFHLHQKLSHLHVRGEWFRYSEEIDELINHLKQTEYELEHWDEIIEKLKNRR